MVATASIYILELDQDISVSDFSIKQIKTNADKTFG